MGVGTDTARIRIEAGKTATVVYTAVVTDKAPERLAFMTTDDGNGYLNIAKTYDVRAEKPDGTEGDKTEYPGIPDKEDEGHTPVQTPDEPPVTPPPTPDEPEYPVIWLMKTSVGDPSHILPGGTFQVLDEEKNAGSRQNLLSARGNTSGRIPAGRRREIHSRILRRTRGSGHERPADRCGS